MNEDKRLLYRMLQDMQKAPPLYQPTHFWRHCLNHIIHDLENSGVSTFRRHPSANGLYVPLYGNGSSGTEQARQDFEIFRKHDRKTLPDFTTFSESDVGAPFEQFCFEGRYFSQSTLNYLRGLTYLKKIVDLSDVQYVLEIGGGFAALGEILLKSDSDRYFYLDVDIPPVAFIATRYLEAVFGPEHVFNYDQVSNDTVISVDKLATRYKAAVLCPWQLPLLEGVFDLFVNFISFQEMEPEVVRNYAMQVNRLVKKYLLLRNQKTGKQVAQTSDQLGVIEPVTRHHYLEFFHPFKLIAADSEMFGRRTNGFDSEVMVYTREA